MKENHAQLNPKKNLAYIGIGSNLADPFMQVNRAVCALSALPHSTCVSVSSFYKTTAVGGIAQPDYINAVLALSTDLTLTALFQACVAIECDFGRKREKEMRWGPRIIDLDILFYNNLQYDSPALCVPHPAAHTRIFVLLPLSEIAPQFVFPDGQSIDFYLANCAKTGIVRLSS